jgi:hypothetical protein
MWEIINTVADTTNYDRVTLYVHNFNPGSSPTPLYHLDEFRYGDLMHVNGTQDTVADLGKTPAGVGGKLSFTGQGARVERAIPGAAHSMNLALQWNNMRISALNDSLAMTFIGTTEDMVDGCWLKMRCSTTRPIGSVWVEILRVDPGSAPNPNAPVGEPIAQSKMVNLLTITNGTLPESVFFEFPYPFVIDGVSTYALVIRGTWAYNPSATLNVYYQLGGTYASGHAWQYDAGTSTWNAGLNQDYGFMLSTWHKVESSFTNLATGGASANIRNAGGGTVRQEFIVPEAVQLKHVHIYARRGAVGWSPGKDSVWLEVSDDTGGTSNANIIGTSVHYQIATHFPDDTVYRWYCFTFFEPIPLQAGEIYTFTVRADYPYNVPNEFIQVWWRNWPNDTGNYPDGAGWGSTEAAPDTWVPIQFPARAIGDVMFRTYGETRPHLKFQAAYSDDDIIYTPFEQINGNEGFKDELTDFEFTGQAKRYWKLRALLNGRAASAAHPLSPVLFDFEFTVNFVDEHWLNIDFRPGADETVTIRRVEWNAKSDGTRGCSRFRLQEKLTDAGAYVDIVDYDDTLTETRRKNGGATITRNGAIFDVSGDYAAVNFTTNREMTDLRMIVMDNIIGSAQINELRAYRVEDFSKDIQTVTIAGSSGFTQRQPDPSTLNLILENTDHHLSVLRSEGGFNEKLGDGVRFLFWVGYEGVLEWVKQGEFYVSSEWKEDAKSGRVSVQAKDLVFIMQNEVQANLRRDQRKHEIIEYFINLCGIPSTDVWIDTSSGIVNYFAPKEIFAWAEIQKVDEACGFGETGVTTDGYVRFRHIGATGTDLRLQNELPALTNVKRLLATAVLGDFVYFVAVQNPAPPGTDEQMHWVSFQISTETWTDHGLFGGAPINFPQKWGAITTTYRGKVIVLTMPDDPTRNFLLDPQSPDFTIWEYDPEVGGLPIEIRQGNFGAHYYRGPSSVFVPWYGGRSGPHWHIVTPDQAIGGTADFAFRSRIIDLATLHIRESDQIHTGAAIFLGGCVVDNETDGPGIVVANQINAGVFTGWEINGWTGKPTQRSSAFGMWNPAEGLGPYLLSGMTASRGNGEVWFKYIPVVVGGFAPLVKMTMNAGNWPLERFFVEPAQETNDTAQVRDALAYLDVQVVGATTDGDAAHLSLPVMISHDFETERTIQHTKELLGASGLSFYRATVIDGQARFYGVANQNQPFEYFARQPTAAGADPHHFITNVAPGGNLLSAKLQSSGRTGGQTQIVNQVIIRSKPLAVQALQDEWQSVGWVGRSTDYVLYGTWFMVELIDPCIPEDTVVVLVTDPPGALTASVRHETPQRVRVDVFPPSFAATITDFRLQSRPIRFNATTIAAARSAGRPRNRHRLKSIAIDNEYVADPMCATIVAGAILARMEVNFPKLIGLNVRGIWTIERYDRIRVTDTRLGLNGDDFYVTAFSHDYRRQVTMINCRRLRPLL